MSLSPLTSITMDLLLHMMSILLIIAGPKKSFELVGGNTTKTWERLDVGSLVSHSFELVSRVKAMYNGTPAVITFRIPMKSKLQEAYSTPILPLDILADRIPAKKLELAKRFFAEYGSLISVICIVVLSGHLIASPSKSSDANRSKKRR
ncbi:hypothetical protein LOK49_LG04G02339 [Camellia lanceoleosa]|uniref:Uncharacterized protein n=1 Tax=Camellia lanceoleosa TaxID=1840588 RepID=A0ACC0I2V5_9ERIC|nr:hypothetical protein LOK49_LG04G02339 [Camellia lanceoleosa]